MAVFRCAGRLRFDDDGQPYCTHEEKQRWLGRCPSCGRPYDCDKIGGDPKSHGQLSSAAEQPDKVLVERVLSGNKQFDFVIGGGFVKGQTILFGGPQGSGKSRLSAQICQSLVERIEQPVLYASAEEPTKDVIKFCHDNGVTSDRVKILGCGSDFNVQDVLEMCRKLKPFLLVLDSLQAIDNWGTRNEQTAELIKDYCDETGMCAIVMNHMTKDLFFKGGTTITHMLKTMLMMYEYDPKQDGSIKLLFGKRFKERVDAGEVRLTSMRTLMSGKNRHGAMGLKAFFKFADNGRLEPVDVKPPKTTQAPRILGETGLRLVKEEDDD